MAVAREAGPSKGPTPPNERKLSLVPPLPPENGQDATTHLNTEFFAEELAKARNMSPKDQIATNTRYQIREAVNDTNQAMTDLETAVVAEREKNKYFDPLMQAELRAARSLTTDQIREQNDITEAKRRIDQVASSGTTHDLTHIRETSKRVQGSIDASEQDWFSQGDIQHPQAQDTTKTKKGLFGSIRSFFSNEKFPTKDDIVTAVEPKFREVSTDDGLRASLDDTEIRRNKLLLIKKEIEQKLEVAQSKKGFFGKLNQALRGVDMNALKTQIEHATKELASLTNKANTLREKLNFKPLRDANTTSRSRSRVTDYKGEGPGVSRMTGGLTRSAGSIEGSQNPKRLQTDPNLLKLSDEERVKAMEKAARDAEDELNNRAA